MRRLAAIFGVMAAALACGSAAGAPADRLEPVIVRFAAVADAGDVEALRAENAHDLRPLLGRFDSWSRAGKVAGVRRLWIIDGVALRATADVVHALARDPAVASVVPDRALPAATHRTSSSADDWNIAAIGASAVWARGYTGRGVVIATLDTGADLSSPALASSWRADPGGWFDPYAEHASPADLNGHGTQVLGIAVGVAPGARWIAARIYDDQGHATTSATHLALQWLLDPDHDPATNDAPQVVVNPWSASYGSCNLEFAPDLLALRSAGILPLFAAGNYGTADASPANNPGAVAVGSTANGDTIAATSSRGPSDCAGSARPFPQLTAPGEGVTTVDRYGGTATVSGTSFAAAHAAGALALLLEAHPGLPVDEQEQVLESSAHDLGPPGPDDTFGYGRLDVATALDAVLAPSFTLAAAPASMTVHAGETATFAIATAPFNAFAGDIQLSASGVSATLEPAVVPATGTSTVTVDTRSLAPGVYSVLVHGTSGALDRSARVALVVLPKPDFTLRLPARAVVKRGAGAMIRIRIAGTGGWSSRVALTVRGKPTGVSAVFAPPRAALLATLTLRANALARPGSRRLVVVASAGGLIRTAPIEVRIK